MDDFPLSLKMHQDLTGENFKYFGVTCHTVIPQSQETLLQLTQRNSILAQ